MPDSSVTRLNYMRDLWDGDPNDLVGMVGKFAFRVVMEEDMNAKAQISGPVQKYLRSAGSATVEQITHALELGDEGLLPVALVVDMHRDIGVLVPHGENRWGYPQQERGPSQAEAAFGLPDLFSDDDFAQADRLAPSVLAVFQERPTEELTMSEVGPSAGIPAEEAVALMVCLDRLEESGQIVRTGDRYGAGPTWRLA